MIEFYDYLSERLHNAEVKGNLDNTLDELVHDEAWEVREAVASIGYGLDVLINDPCWQVRYTVAMLSYGLDQLINDKNKWVSLIAVEKIEERLHNNDDF